MYTYHSPVHPGHDFSCSSRGCGSGGCAAPPRVDSSVVLLGLAALPVFCFLLSACSASTASWNSLASHLRFQQARSVHTHPLPRSNTNSDSPASLAHLARDCTPVGGALAVKVFRVEARLLVCSVAISRTAGHANGSHAAVHVNRRHPETSETPPQSLNLLQLQPLVHALPPPQPAAQSPLPE